MKLLKLILFSLFILLFSCTKSKPNIVSKNDDISTSGIILKKWYEPGKNKIMTASITDEDTVITETYKIYDGENWCIKIKKFNDSENEAEIYYVTHEAYDSLNIGKVVCLKDFSTKDFNNQKIN